MNKSFQQTTPAAALKRLRGFSYCFSMYCTALTGAIQTAARYAGEIRA